MNVILLNGSTAPRVKSSDGVTVLPCGCAHTDVRYLQMCEAEHAEWSARHALAQIDHDRSKA